MNAPVPSPVATAPGNDPLRDPALYINRELSQLDFNFRVLAQAMDEQVPLLERLRFLCISCTNLDEFFEIRAAAVRHAQEFGLPPAPDGMSPQEILTAIHDRAAELVEQQYRCWNEVLRPALQDAGIGILSPSTWTPRQRRWLRAYFRNEIMPVLSPLGLDPSHPFPKILNKSLNIVVVLKGTDAFGRAGHLALVRAPRSLPRIIQLPKSLGGTQNFVLLSAVLSTFVNELFPGMDVRGAYQFRVTRNSELVVDEEEVENLALALRDELVDRGYRPAVRLEIAHDCPRAIVQTLLQNFGLSENAAYRIDGSVNLNRVIQVYDLVQRPELKYPPMTPRVLKTSEGIFEAVARGDVLLHHPFDSFSTVLELIREAAVDPNVLAIKQTLYRTGKDSGIVEALIQAARNGKDVTVVVELRARFDEEANLGLADRLQDAGVQVVYGVVGYKTHAKMLLVVRREGRKLRRYVHLGTGNYHSGTARAYTDLSLITADPDIGNDVHQLFQQLSGLASKMKMEYLLQSPFTLHAGLLQRIERETRLALDGKPGRIIAKMNALNEPQVIRALYAASQAGVQIDLIVRGACTLRPGVEGVSDNIRVRSIVGRFLEHSRVYWFGNNGAPELYCASADWLERNLLRRVETCFPILDSDLARRIYREVLQNYLDDNLNAWELQADGRYRKCTPQPGQPPHSAQQALLEAL
ncbi:MAG: RNA degradosome polyphosphate kinase [Lysobacteraceae bacterium SCN 69-123]|jgi:polyphosphate kinase|uniref:polyphosphate kinase 1 n=1 Tax=Stenotrophomonas acidaminiphila TaxID=128780 RepID=UPI000869EA42|nr:polyphosphate kinase 1 [Stenotrophomonas acidaminiphila]MBN8800846.1 polyphosphate kinase 1 [Stenotrophomonas acidaminiphila]MDF9442807.1 polyphosphate kinase 1 [Stenotrophomonas acidaminiphila]ODU40881.1 MAG: RNA degradosome polyphosphate kinase [Xanthomonadaceae bacterium SCN 69-123]OJY78134.1 MAG: RNA degradosome polyphosphate kinase [Stenotrophomonas sp. 69-14]